MRGLGPCHDVQGCGLALPTLNLPPVRRPSLFQLTAITATSAVAAVSLSGAEAVLAIDRPVASRLKRYGGLLPTPRAGNAGALRWAPVVSTTAGLLVLLCLPASLAAFWSRVPTLPEKGLVLAGKREFLSAVAAGELHVLCHKTLSSTLLLYSAGKRRPPEDGGGRSIERLAPLVPSLWSFES